MDGLKSGPFKSFLHTLGYLGALGSIIALSLTVVHFVLVGLLVAGAPYYSMLFGFGMGGPLLLLVLSYLMHVAIWQRDQNAALRDAEAALRHAENNFDASERRVANLEVALQDAERKLGDSEGRVANLETAVAKRDQTIATLESHRTNGEMLDNLLAPHLIEMCLQDITLIEREMRNEKGKTFVKAKHEHVGQLKTYISVCEARFERDQEILVAIDSKDVSGVQNQYRTLKLHVIELLKKALEVLKEAPNRSEESEAAIRKAHQLVNDAKHSLQVVHETLST